MISKYGPELMPRRQNEGDAGYDLYAPYEMTIGAGHTVTFDTGVALEDADIKESQFIMILPRSSMGFQYGLRMSNTACIVDSGYRDTIKISISVDKPLTLHRGERFAQMIVVDYGLIAGEIKPSKMRNGGIGSTGRM